jgi:hypothetical protein
LIHVKKNESIIFQVNVIDLQNKGLLTLYRRLQKNRVLARFSREAFIEKAYRYLNGLDEQYAKLNNCIKTKGIEYILEAVQEKEERLSNADEIRIEKVTDKIIEVLMNALQNESHRPAPINSIKKIDASSNRLHVAAPINTITTIDAYKDVSQNKPDIEKLKALL